MFEKSVRTDSARQTASIFGPFDSNIKKLEDTFSVTISNSAAPGNEGDSVRISGEDLFLVEKAAQAVESLKKLSKTEENIPEQNVDYICQMLINGHDPEVESFSKGYICISSKGKLIKAKTSGQNAYVNSIKNNTVTFGIGPAGTGKTFLAVAMAVNSLRSKETSRIILTRPAVEAGEKLGFLPGDLQNKIEPYLRPLYDSLYELLGPETYIKLREKNVIEIAPLAYMRGRTLDDSFIILDEAQNTTSEQMKMFLTRLGFNSKAVVTGDITQIDLPFGKRSGLVTAVKILEGIDDISVHRFTEMDVVRHRLVRKIIGAYEKYEKGEGAASRFSVKRKP